ncbi:MAG TPA: hypothetical protein VMV14_04325 [Acidimicrobiales bacterium]|nr:hypothetical protein [Acidimicrobiales bacterium]
MSVGRKTRLCALGAGAIALVAAWAGAAAASSGGGYNQGQQDCSLSSSSWATPDGVVEQGCHSFAISVESGGMTNGDANGTNTRYVEWGSNEEPLESSNPSITEIGDPGTQEQPHSGCVAANTGGTGGGTGTGCGNNANGSGFEWNYDYYDFYCPLFHMVPEQNVGPLYQCGLEPGPGPGGQTLNPSIDTGTQNALVDTQNPLDSVLLTQGLLVYIGATDNLDRGEHDGFDGLNNTDGTLNGNSDGGAITLSATPEGGTNTPTATHPEGLANFSYGFCADGICNGATTQQQAIYYGCYDPTSAQDQTWANNGVDTAATPPNNTAGDQCQPGTAQSTDAYQNNTPASTQESGNCSSGGPASSETACYTNQNGSPNPNGANGYRSNTPQQVDTEPGVQTYQDPDPQRSPIVAMPGAYAGTCGVYLNDSGGAGYSGTTGLDPGYVVGPGSSYVDTNGLPVSNSGC